MKNLRIKLVLNEKGAIAVGEKVGLALEPPKDFPDGLIRASVPFILDNPERNNPSYRNNVYNTVHLSADHVTWMWSRDGEDESLLPSTDCIKALLSTLIKEKDECSDNIVHDVMCRITDVDSLSTVLKKISWEKPTLDFNSVLVLALLKSAESGECITINGGV